MRNFAPMKFFLTSLLALMSLGQVLAQGITLSPLNSRLQTESKNQNFNLLGIRDTIFLPFFDDFANNTNGQPSDFYWVDRQVWISNGFFNRPINQYLAVFDHLNTKGKPYTTINQNVVVFADSLTSQPINLKTKKNNTAYGVKDSIILSFFWGTGGLGDPADLEDSLILYFKNDTNGWQRIWAGGGNGSNQDLRNVQVKLTDPKWFYKGFQFRFVNLTKASGNLNHFFLDYIAMDGPRTLDNTYKGVNDVGITKVDRSLLLEYTQMPYSHFMNSPSSFMKPKHCLVARNLNLGITEPTYYQLDYFNRYGTKVATIPFNSSAKNITANGDTSECFNTPRLDTLSGLNPYMDVQYTISPRGSVIYFPETYNSQSNNNVFTKRQQFNPWYAYDDGGAEGGIGLDYTSLPTNHKGQFALQFNNKRTDSLKGVAIYFNQSKEDVAFRTFKLKIWKSLSPLNQPDNLDKVVHSQVIDKPIYTDSVDGFAYIMFDTAILMSAGDFYVGWEQNQKFLLNVGYDNTYRFNDEQRFNPNVYFNLLSSWKKAFDVFGTPMIRPIFGQRQELFFSTKTIDPNSVNLFPNPTTGIVNLSGLPNDATIKVLNVKGKLMLTTKNNQFDMSEMPAGLYFCQIEAEQAIITKRIIKQ